jgi:hypothetical protein
VNCFHSVPRRGKSSPLASSALILDCFLLLKFCDERGQTI